MDKENQQWRILMLPLLADGHVLPFLELGKKLTKRNFEVFLCSTAASLNPFRKEAEDDENLHFREIHLPEMKKNPKLSLENQTTRNLPPDLAPALFAAFDGAKDHFREIVREIKPHIVIYDYLQPWAPEVAEELGIPAVLFITGGAASYSFLYHYSIKNPSVDQHPISQLKHLPEIHHQNALMFVNAEINGITNKERTRRAAGKSSRFVLIRCLDDELEQKYREYISVLLKKEAVSLGHFIRNPENDESAGHASSSAIYHWLETKEPNSTVFASFGTECSLSREEIEEIALGLELSQVNFIWVIKNYSDLDEVLPEGYQNRVGERGLLIKTWAPQTKILRHQSVAGFVSHCGWNSILESLAFGVPIVAMPMSVDQPYNSMFLEEIGVAMEVVRTENGKFGKEEIANVIKEVVGGERGKDSRNKANELSGKIAEKGEKDFDSAVRKLMQLVE
ncbi:OLC1v1005651C1 [Oldenlandia corymbosa var. corymbosa]|uniref:Glycosyltransferase n=1 Tax=Oldenlandia corymbosa var. corymbosa TaxID=529605 RepID=A0AAV1DHH4_OLDCO|nr:OLC1v1005651C1 [Oldenlandia corymbosa var. corymbosa]